MKTCKKCLEDKEPDCFFKHTGTKDRLTTWCKGCFREYRSDWANKNRDKLKGYWRKNNHKYKDRRAERERKLSQDPVFKLTRNTRTYVWQALKSKGIKKDNRTFAAIGYTPEELKAHIERQFTGGMSWDNYGEWHVDHIRPLSGFDFTSMECEAFKEAWSLANLQPLWAIENLEKAAKQTVLV